MKKKITVDGFQCDGCGKETEYAVECRSCDKTFCLNCMEKAIQEYEDRGKSYYYCHECDNRLTQDHKDDAHRLLRLINKTKLSQKQNYADHTAELDRLSERLKEELQKEEGELPF